MRSLSKLWAGSMILAVAVGLIAMAGSATGATGAPSSGSHQASHSTPPAWEKAVEHLKLGAPVPGRSSTGCPPGTTQAESLIWAGYVSCPRTVALCPPHCVLSVLGKTRPSPRFTVCEDCGYLVAFGMDGYRDSTAELAGFGAHRSGGVTEYFTWWDMFPGSIQIVGTTVRPGDQISASVTRHGTSYTFSVIDATTAGNSFTAHGNCGNCDNSNAEWIVQPYGTSPITDFGELQITGATAKIGSTTGSISAFPHAELTLVNSAGTVLVQPGPLNSPGTSFRDVWKASS